MVLSNNLLQNPSQYTYLVWMRTWCATMLNLWQIDYFKCLDIHWCMAPKIRSVNRALHPTSADTKILWSAFFHGFDISRWQSKFFRKTSVILSTSSRQYVSRCKSAGRWVWFVHLLYMSLSLIWWIISSSSNAEFWRSCSQPMSPPFPSTTTAEVIESFCFILIYRCLVPKLPPIQNQHWTSWGDWSHHKICWSAAYI